MFFNDDIWLVIMKIRLKIKNRSQKYDINRRTSRNGHNYTKYKMCLSMMMIICIKQHLSNIGSSVREKVKLKKSVTYIKKRVLRKNDGEQTFTRCLNYSVLKSVINNCICFIQHWGMSYSSILKVVGAGGHLIDKYFFLISPLNQNWESLKISPLKWQSLCYLG